MATTDNDVVNEWLDRLNDLQPVDGGFTQAVLDSAGKFPIEKPPGDAFDQKDDDAKAFQHYKGTVARRSAFEMAQHRVRMATLKSERMKGELSEKHSLNARYWSEISDWLQTLL